MFRKRKLKVLKAFTFLVLLFSFQVSAACIFKVRVNDAPPQYMLQDGKWTGKAVELMEVLLREANCKPEYIMMPWQRALMELEKGNIDAMMNVGYNEQRAKSFYYISPYIYETTVLLTRKDLKFDINSLNDLKRLPHKIGYEAGNIYDNTFTSKFLEDEDFHNLFQATTSGDNTEMVFLGRLSGKITLSENARYALDVHPKYNEQMKIHPLVVSKLPTFFAFSRQTLSDKKMIELHDANIRVISKGLYEDIKRRWE